MAVRLGVRETESNDITTLTWLGLTQASADTGGGVQCGDLEGLVAQITGTLGAGGAVPIEGSNDGTTWGAMVPALSLAALNVITPIPTVPKFIRPGTTAGDGTTLLALRIIGRKQM